MVPARLFLWDRDRPRDAGFLLPLSSIIGGGLAELGPRGSGSGIGGKLMRRDSQGVDT